MQKPFLWVAFPKVLGGYRKIIDLALSLGFGGLAPRAGQGGWNDASLKPEDIKAIRDAGLECSPWFFSMPTRVIQEVDGFQRLEDAGATSLIIDAEIPWDRDPLASDHAKQYGELAAKNLSVPVYDAPWPMIDWHPGYPEKAFRWVAGRLLQTYWTEIGRSAESTFLIARSQWAKREAPERVLPIGVTYGKSEMVKWGQNPPTPRDMLDEDLVASIPYVRGGWYTAEAAKPETLRRIAELLSLGIGPATPEPGLELGDGGPAHPLGVADRAERIANQLELAGAPERSEASTNPETPTGKSSDRIAAIRLPVEDPEATWNGEKPQGGGVA